MRSTRSHCAAAAAAVAAVVGLSGQSGSDAGLETLKSLLDLRQSPGALCATVAAGRGDVGGGRGLLDELVHALARVLIQARFGEQCRHALEAGFVAFPVTVCGI